eukprot:COSAG01_NODE_5342_length_4324_cov_2.688521_3_plen_367_part_00
MEPSVCLAFPRAVFTVMRELMPDLPSAASEVFISKYEAEHQKRTSKEFLSYSHVQDRRIRVFLDAMQELDVSDLDKSCATTDLHDGRAAKLEQWTRNRSAQVGDELPANATWSFVFKEYLHHQQDCCAPEGCLGTIGDSLEDYLDSRDGSFVKHPLAKLRWNAFTKTRIRDKNSYSSEKKQMHLPSLFTHEDYERVQRERRFVSSYALLMCVTLHGYVWVHLRMVDANMSGTEVIAYAVFMCATILAFGIFVAWFCSLLLAVSLVRDGIRDLREEAFGWARANNQKHREVDNWELRVQAPSAELANYILPALSAWAGGIGPTFVCVWLFCFLSLPLAARCVPSPHRRVLTTCALFAPVDEYVCWRC